MASSDFVHLHTHTEFSLLDGMCKIPVLVKRTRDLGMTALAITDHGNMFGAIQFYQECVKQKIKPIIGCEMYMATRSHKDKEPDKDSERNHLVLLAQNQEGYRNLMRLVSESHLYGFYYRPRIDRQLLVKYSQGLIALSGCLGGEVPQALRVGAYEHARRIAGMYKDIFGQDHFFLELQHHAIADLRQVNTGLLRLSKELDLPVVATNDIHYIYPEDAEAHDILLCIQTGKTVNDKDRLTMLDSPDFFLRSPQEMENLFRSTPAALSNTKKIADMIDLTLTLGKFTYPNFPVPQGESPASYLRSLVEQRRPTFYPTVTDAIKKRIAFELDVITRKGYAPYFLIVQDFVNWARNRGIAVGPGRGSAAGSIVSYILGITSIDPLEYALPFERFINPKRPSAPDIDLDFADDRRDEVVAYVTNKYGADHVANICTFGTMMSRGSVRDVGRALGHPYAYPDKIAKLIPFSTQTNYIPIKKAIEMVPELKQLVEDEPDAKKLLDLAQKVEGVVRHASVHAAGIVISPEPLWNYTPLMRETKGDKIVTQYEMHSVGEDGVGLLKIDFLGLSNLSIIQQALANIKTYRGKDVELATIPNDDKKAFAMLSQGETTGIFQLESSGMRRYIKELKPSNVYDLMAMVALFRPGPMNAIPEYIRRKHNPALVRTLDPRMDKILERSLGLLVYQDDVLLIAIELAGYDWQEVDKLRKAMGKKIAREMKAQKEKFLERSIARGLPHEKAEQLWQEIEIFAGYGFNKAHAACYGTIAYQTAYLKAHYPEEFMAAVMTIEAQNTEKIFQAMDECRRMDIAVLPPSVNASGASFTLEEKKAKKAIRFGLAAVKNVGLSAIASIQHAREKDGAFTSLYNLCSRVDLRLVNRKTLESLIKAGATTMFGPRSAQLAALDTILHAAHREQKQRASGQVGLFDGGESGERTADIALPSIDEVPKQELLRWEKDLLGFYLTEHPLTAALSRLAPKRTTRIRDLTPEGKREKIVIAGVLESVRRIFTKKRNEEMAFVRLADESGDIEAVLFPRTFIEYKDLLVEQTIVVAHGTCTKREDERNVIIDRLYSVEDAPDVKAPQRQPRKEEEPVHVAISIPAEADRQVLLEAYELLKSSPGEARVGLMLPHGGAQKKLLRTPYRVAITPPLTTQLEALFGLGSFLPAEKMIE